MRRKRGDRRGHKKKVKIMGKKKKSIKTEIFSKTA